MHRLQLQATFTITDDKPVIEAGKARAESDAGAPDMINTAGDALIELFNLLDDEGNPFLALEGTELESLKYVKLCTNEECGRVEHR